MNAESIQLYSYWRSSAAYRVRIALNLKGLDYQVHPVNLIGDGGQQHAQEFAEINPQELVPVLVHGCRVLRQSMAIIEYLDEVWPDNPLIPSTVRLRERSRAIAQMIACDIHPLNNLRVMQYLETHFSASPEQRLEWTRHWIGVGFAALEKVLEDNPSTGRFCEGDMPTMADCCLVPQVYNARRVSLDLAPFPNIRRIDEACLALDAFARARPENQVDAPASVSA